MRLSISIEMDATIRGLLTNSGKEDQHILERRGRAAAILMDARDALDALMEVRHEDGMFPPPPPAIKITVREGGGVPPLNVTVEEGDSTKDMLRKVKDAIRTNQWPS